MLTRTGRGTALIAAAILSGCAADVVSQQGPAQPGTTVTLAYAARNGEMATVIIGNPFDLPKERVDAAVTDAMAGSYAGPEIRFTTTPAPDAPKGYDVVVLLDGPPAMDARLLCRARDRVSPQPTGTDTTVVIAFCASGQTLNAVSGRMPLVTAPEDPAFRGMIARAMVQLIPTKGMQESDLRQ